MSAPDPVLIERLFDKVAPTFVTKATSSPPDPVRTDVLPLTDTLSKATLLLPEPSETERLVPTETAPRLTSVSGLSPAVAFVLPITMSLLPLPAEMLRFLLIVTLAIEIVLLPELPLIVRLPVRLRAVPEGSPIWIELAPDFI